MRRASLVCAIAILALSGCATGAGTHWYAPATWFSHGAADRADKASAAVDTAGDKAVKEAQKLAHSTQVALLSAPASRPVDAATKANDGVVGLLDQVAGPLTSGDMTAIREQMAALLSDNAAIRAKAEAQRDADSAKINAVSSALAKAQAANDAAQDKLRSAFERENALANELRTERAIKWIAVSVGILALIAWGYVRYFLGGVPGAIGKALASIETKSPDMASELRMFLDAHLNRGEQTRIATEYAKAKS